MGVDVRADPVRTLADSVSDAIIVAGADHRIVRWNRGAMQMFGWTAEEIVGQLLTVLMPERYRDAHLAGVRRLQQTGRPNLLGAGPVALEGLAKDGHEFPIELTLGRWTEDGGDLFVGIVRDVTERREGELFAAAQYAVARALGEATSSADAGERLLASIGEALDWPLGALWLVDEADDVLRLAALWHAPRIEAADFEEQSREVTFGRGVGLPGRTWAAGRGQWIDDVTVDANFPRVRAATAAGLHGGIGLPLVTDGRVNGVMEFFSPAVRAPRPRLLALMTGICEHAGQFLQRKHAEERLARATRRDRQAEEINAQLLHHLVQASDAFDRGDVRSGRRELQAALNHASRIITELGVPRA